LRECGVQAELVVANGLPQSKLVEHTNASNVVILPSLHEGSPNIVKEAMACNVPVVAADVGDVSQLIGHTTGCTVCSHDVEAFAEALKRAIAHNGPTSGRHDIAHLERSMVAKQVITLFADPLARRRAAARIRHEYGTNTARIRHEYGTNLTRSAMTAPMLTAAHQGMHATRATRRNA
jgi:glycosyltransferase involved in cell wall biosynthesis